MTRFALVLAATLVASPLAFAQPARPQAPAATAAPFTADAVVAVNGLVCDFCAQALTKSFKRHAEVREIRVDLTAKRVSIDFAPGASLDDAALRRIITNAGYAVTGITRTGGAS